MRWERIKGGLDGKRGVRQVFGAEPVPAGAAPFGSGTNPVSGFRGARQAFNLSNDRVPDETISRKFHTRVSLSF